MRYPTLFRPTLLALLGLFLLGLAACSSDDSPVGPGNGGQRTVLLLTDGGTEAHVEPLLTGAGFTVRDGGLFHEFTGTGLDASVDAVILLGGPEYNNDMQDEGEAALVGFVAQGGGLLVTEWFSYSVNQGKHQILATVLPTAYGGTYGSGTETYTVQVDHPVTKDLPATFASENDSEYSILAPRNGATQLIRGSRSEAAVVTWDVPGRVVTWNFAAGYGGDGVWNDDFDQLMLNIAGYLCASPRTAEPIVTQAVKMESRNLYIINDGDGAAGSTSSRGDFFITARLTINVNGIVSDLGRVDGKLIQGADGSIETVGILLDAVVPLYDGIEVAVKLSYYENDPGGPQASAGNTYTFVYDAAAECWALQGEDACASAGNPVFDELNLQDFSGDPLDVRLTWRFEVE